MDYEQALEYIYSARKFQKSGGLERMERLLELMGNPHKRLSFVHIVGTNGKGSASSALAYIAESAGYIAGLFTSPFVVEFGERIQVNHEYISHGEIAEICEEIKEKIELMSLEGLHPTVFEITTALAMVYFEHKKCDIVFLEAGIGGEHDSTNVIPAPLCCLFMSISLDHTEMLGHSVEEIAREKSGIIKENTMVVSYPDFGADKGFAPQPQQAVEIIKTVCRDKQVPFRLPREERFTFISSDMDGSRFLYDGMEIELSVCGRHQIGNMLAVIEAAKCLQERGFVIGEKDIRAGLGRFTMPCRMEKVSQSPMIILDGGHNEGCIRALLAAVREYLPGKKITALMAFMRDKDWKTAIEVLAPVCETMIFTATDPLRSEPAENLCRFASAFCGRTACFGTVERAFSEAISATNADGVLLVAGSFYLAGEVRSIIKKEKARG
ncbi:MAG: bifunctional folylpolyglutamate synthase/dihydrofolate synthase [Acutalibacteraceae bacterium]